MTDTKHTPVTPLVKDCVDELLYCKTGGLNRWQSIDDISDEEVERLFAAKLTELCKSEIEADSVRRELLEALKALDGRELISADMRAKIKAIVARSTLREEVIG